MAHEDTSPTCLLGHPRSTQHTGRPRGPVREAGVLRGGWSSSFGARPRCGVPGGSGRSGGPVGERSHRSQGRESGQGDHFLEETEEFRCPEPCLGSGWTAFTHGILPTRRLKPSGGKDMPPTPGWPRFHTRCPHLGGPDTGDTSSWRPARR